MDKNIIIKDLGNGFFLLRPKKNYSLFSVRLNRAVSEAVVREKEINNFQAIEA